MDTTNEPLEAINAWQEWYKTHRVVAELDKPLASKDSRENLHDTTEALDSFVKTTSFQKAKEYFSDTLCEFSNELSGKDLYKAFYAAALEVLDIADKEYKKAKDLVDMLRCING